MFFILILLLSRFTVLKVYPQMQKNYLETFTDKDYSLKIVLPNIEKAIFSEENKRDSYQFNITLAELPKTNTFLIPLETIGLQFYYQPPLNEELNPKDYAYINATHALNDKGEVIIYRADPGSYAVYKDKVGVGETGKLYHISVPVCYDAKGDSTRAILHITKNLLQITVNAEWLAKAAYPVVIDPTFGYTSIGGTADNGVYKNYCYVCQFTNNAGAGTVTKITGYVGGAWGGANADVNAVIYNDNAGTTNNLLASSVTTDLPATAAWVDFTVSAIVSDSTIYYLGLAVANIADAKGYYDSGAANQWRRSNAGYPAPNPFTGPSQTAARIYSFYATIEAAANPESVSLELNDPADTATVTEFAQIMNYTPTLIGSDSFHNATLYVNNTGVISNQTVIQNATINSLGYTFSSNGTYLWDVLLYNSTHSVWAINGNFTLTVAVYEPDPTPTPTSSPSGELEDEDTGFLIAAVIISVVLAATVCLILFRKVD